MLRTPHQPARLASEWRAAGVPWLMLFGSLTAVSVAGADVQRMVPIIASASVVSPDDSVSSACRSLECVRRRVGASTTVRLAGEFGRFTGRVTHWDADSLTAFEVDPDWGGSAPAAPISWSQISRVDQRVNYSGRGAVIGAISLGAITALFAATVSSAANVFSFGASADADRETRQAALKGALIGGALGAGIGAGIGAGSNHWILLYRRW